MLGQFGACYFWPARFCCSDMVSLNLAPTEFRRVIGIYVATLFVIWQIVNFVAFRSLPNGSILVGGALIVAGGAIVTFWE
jgi:hypothetical protein